MERRWHEAARWGVQEKRRGRWHEAAGLPRMGSAGETRATLSWEPLLMSLAPAQLGTALTYKQQDKRLVSQGE